MIDFPILAHLIMWGFVALVVIMKVFNWGYEKEQKGERTDFLGRSNSHPSKEDMD